MYKCVYIYPYTNYYMYKCRFLKYRFKKTTYCLLNNNMQSETSASGSSSTGSYFNL